ncbi:MAG TPA: DNA repair protein RadC [Spirochaetota bacterium]|nr:DNA repair protein RadC [Spirochaetota bacterium]HPI22259.1 DNA repair protein RadC [Spirochaetota bacterium]HPU89483.1 DNA repair protein RadC [Spirochaetota bacterium]
MAHRETPVTDTLPVQRCRDGADIRELADHELVAIIIGTGTRGTGVVRMGMEILERFGGVRGIRCAGLRELANAKGMGMVKAARLQAALELGRRAMATVEPGASVSSPRRVWELLRHEIAGVPQEVFRVLVLNSKNLLVKNRVVSVGTISAALIHPREIYRDAIRETGSSIIIAHNHPSGVLTPSGEDIAATKRIADAGNIIGIALLDHVIIAEAGYLSLREAGYM